MQEELLFDKIFMQIFPMFSEREQNGAFKQ
jgi:hypothetical protein